MVDYTGLFGQAHPSEEVGVLSYKDLKDGYAVIKESGTEYVLECHPCSEIGMNLKRLINPKLDLLEELLDASDSIDDFFY